MNKFDRVISTLILLQTKKRLKASFISERFDISLRTVYRDIHTLKNAGIPIIGEPGIGYSIMQGYKIPPVIFNEEEASALLTAEKFIGKVTDEVTEKNYSNALMKIKAILRSSEKESLAILEESIAVSTTSKNPNKSYLQELFKGISSKRVLKIEYKKADETISEREIEPIGCYHERNNWYLFAYCQVKEAYRTFKVNRIRKLNVLEDQFITEHISLQNYIDRQKTEKGNSLELYSIEIAFTKGFVKFADVRKHYFGFIEQEEKNGLIHMKFLNNSIEYIARWIMQFGNQATAIEPIELKERMQDLANELFTHYKKN